MAAKDLYEKDFYKVLGVDKKADADEIKKRYRALARDLHPDKTKGDAVKEEQFKAVSEAYEILSDPKKRAEYDEARSLFARGGFRAHKAVATSETSSEVETHKIFSPIYLVLPPDVVDRAKVKIYKQKQQFHFVNQFLVQPLIFA